MKKIILILCACLLLTGCKKSNAILDDNDNTFISVEKTWYYEIVYHKDTRVMYTVSRGSHNQGSFTLLVNADGTPMIYEGEVEE